MSSLINKVKDALSSDHSTTEQPEGTHGTHNSRAANAADPRIDSDRDHRANPTHTTGHTTTGHTAGQNFGTTGGHSTTSHTGGHGLGTSGTTAGQNFGTTGGHSTTSHTGGHGLGTSGTTAGEYGHSGQTGNYSSTGNTAGGIGSGAYGSGNTGSANRTDGPHNSDLLNKVDPRVDSDRDGSRNLGNQGTTGGFGSTGRSTGTHTGQTGNYSSTGNTAGGIGSGAYGSGNTGSANRTDGPHNSNLLNKADPRVDSDRDGGRNLGNQGTTGGFGSTGHSTGTHTGTGAHTGTHTSGAPEGTYGTHNSRVANAADPRIDSDRDGSRNLGNQGTTGGFGSAGHSTGTHTGTHTGTGTHAGTHTSGAPEGTYGTHNSRVANAADPRIDSDRDGSRNVGGRTGGTHTGTHTGAQSGTHTGAGGLGGNYSSTGPAPNTAGPHKSDLLNKADPRVDSNLDGSKTLGQEKTFDQQGSSSLAHKDPTDAAQVPPSVLQKHIGAPIVDHDDANHNREKRHSVSHQDQHRGL